MSREPQDNPEVIIELIMDITPSDTACKHPLVAACGRYIGDLWQWNKERLVMFSPHDLVKIYHVSIWKDN